ncbi:MAG: lysophospholipase [Acutalibacter sp.]|jgi:lysophospholipase L1-like esterase|nr:lysophospholipase [Acutalibacter sp.]
MQENAVQAFMEDFNRRQTEQKIENYRRLNRFAKPGQIVFTGSSLMEQFPLYELIQGAGLPWQVYNRGIGGFVTTQLLEALDVCVLQLRPAYVFINIGTNDMNGPDYSLAGMLERYGEILGKIKEALPQAGLHLLAYYPVNREAAADPFMAEVLSFRTNAVLEEANRAVKALAERAGASFHDVGGGLKDEKGRLKAGYTVEGMHLYADGYKAVLDALLPVLNDLQK